MDDIDLNEDFPNKVTFLTAKFENTSDIISDGLLSLERSFVVENLIEENTIIVFYGAPKSGKSLCVEHLCYFMATGQTWCDHEVKCPANVIYLAFEDPHLLELRAKALLKQFPPPNPKARGQFKIINNPPNVFDAATIMAITDSFELMRDTFEFGHSVLVIDTLALASETLGEENTSTTMGKVVQQFQKYNKNDITVILVHHSGKDRTKGMRGHNSLEAGVDNIFEVSKKKNNTVSVRQTQWRNGESGKTIELNLIITDVPAKRLGKKVFVSMPVLNFKDLSLKAPKNFSRAELIVLKEITTLLETNPFDPPPNIEIPLNVKAALLEDVYKATKAAGISPNGKTPRASKIATDRALENLNEKGLIKDKDGFIWKVHDDETLPDK